MPTWILVGRAVPDMYGDIVLSFQATAGHMVLYDRFRTTLPETGRVTATGLRSYPLEVLRWLEGQSDPEVRGSLDICNCGHERRFHYDGVRCAGVLCRCPGFSMTTVEMAFDFEAKRRIAL